MLIPIEVLNARITSACEKSVARYALNAVHVSRDADGCHATATDGRRLVRVNWKDDEARAEFPAEVPASAKEGFQALIKATQWEEAAQLGSHAAKSKRHCLRYVALDEQSADGKIKLASYDMETVRAIEVPPVDGRFPDAKSVIPQYENAAQCLHTEIPDNAAVTVRVNAEYLSELLQVVAKAVGMGPHGGYVNVTVPITPGRLIRVDAEDKVRQVSAVGVLAPIVGD